MSRDTTIFRLVRNYTPERIGALPNSVTPVMARGRSSHRRNGIMKLGWITFLLGITHRRKEGSLLLILCCQVENLFNRRAGTDIAIAETPLSTRSTRLA